jgi:hypothetical protein
MPSVNELLLDAEISHQVNLAHFSNGVVRRIIALLNKVDPDLVAQLTLALDQLPAESFTVERLEQMLFSVRVLNARAYRLMGEELRKELQALTVHEIGFQFDLFRSTLPARIDVASVSAEQAYAAAMSRPFQGRLLSEFLTGIEADRATRIRDAVRMGYIEGQSIGEIVQRVRGTRARGYSDGIIEIDRRHAEAVVRTAVSHTAGVARDKFNGANGDLVKAEKWLSTLDTHTTEMCRIRDGLKYTPGAHKPIGHSIPWLSGPGRLHWCCRSTSTQVTKSLRELGIPMDDFTPSERASMDGAVAADTTYAQWFAKQSAARQDEIVGPTRGALYRRGGIAFDKFYNDRGVYLDLEQLKERDAAAFERAGV